MRRQLAATLMNISAHGMISNQFSRAIFHAALARHEEASEVTAPTVLNQSLIGRPGRRRSRGLPAVAVGISCESRRSPVAGWPALADNFSLRRVSRSDDGARADGRFFLIFAARLFQILHFWGCVMMQWKKDLESLVEQTRAMVKHASQRGIGAAARSEVPPAPEPIQSSSAPKPAPPPKPSPQKTAQPQKTASPQSWSTPQLTFDAPAREEILQRVAGFRAHQEKMRREREDYYLEMTEKMRAILRNDIQSKH